MHILVDEKVYNNLKVKEQILYELGHTLTRFDSMDITAPSIHEVHKSVAEAGHQIINTPHSSCITQ